MRGLAVFISDIRNCEWRLGRGGAWAGPGWPLPWAVALWGRGLLSFSPVPDALLFPLTPAASWSERYCLTKWRRAPGGGGGGGAGSGGGRRRPKAFGCSLGLVCAFWVGWLRYFLTHPHPSCCGGALGVVVAGPVEGGAEASVPAVVLVYKALERSRRVFGVWVGLWQCRERHLWSPSQSVNGFQFKTSRMESRPL